MNIFKKHKHHNLIQATTYTLLALILMIIGFVKSEPLAFGATIIVGACAFYWICKSKI